MSRLEQYRNIRQKYFQTRPFSLDDTGVTHREITYWDERDLLPVKTELNKWRRFSLVELAWIRFIANLRKLNVGLDTMGRIKHELFKDIAGQLPIERVMEQVEKTLKENDSSFDPAQLDKPEIKTDVSGFQLTYFEFVLYSILLENSRVSIAIAIKSTTEDAEATAVDDDFFMELIHWDRVFSKGISPEEIDTLLGTCICISINEILSDVFKKVSELKLSKLFALSEQEVKILEVIRQGQYKEIHVRFREKGVPDLIITHEKISISATTRLVDIITRKAYEDVIIKNKDGVIVHAERIKNIKL